MIRFTALPPTLPLYSPAALAATWFGSGLLRPAPGTWGTIAALPFAFVIEWAGGPFVLALAALLVFTVGVWAAGHYCVAAEKDDAPEIVIDEVAAVWLVVAALPATVAGLIAAFILFRFFDILKPWPIRLAERRFKGGFGVMIDDMLAALLATLTYFVFDILWRVVS